MVIGGAAVGDMSSNTVFRDVTRTLSPSRLKGPYREEGLPQGGVAGEQDKRPDRVSFPGRILFLTEDPDLLDCQLAGEDLSCEQAGRLRDDLSTDEITPAHICYYYDDKLGDFPYLGLKAGDRFPCKPELVRAGGFVVSVAGARRGKGSSREASPYAELCAGIRLVIAESFERIYRQNCQNLGLLTSTDFGLIERIRSGEAIPLQEFTAGQDPITAEIVRRGGLFAFNSGRLAGEIKVAVPDHDAGPMTYAEKLIARAVVSNALIEAVGVRRVRPGDGVFVKTHWRFSHEYVTPMAASFLETSLGTEVRVREPDTVLAFRDHLTFLPRSMPAEKKALGLLTVAEQLPVVQKAFCTKQGIRLHGELPDGSGSEGICHAIMTERYVTPGQVVVGTDSHTCHSGALGCLAFGVGTTDIANAWVTGDVRLTVPSTCRVILSGHLPDGVVAKDLVLYLLRLPYIREGHAIGQVIEYQGEALSHMSTDERATLTNMAAEIGGFTGLIAPDEETLRFIRARRGESLAIEPWMCGDGEAEYAYTIAVDCTALRPMVARPGDPGNGCFIDEIGEEIRIDLAYGGSCTGGKREDLTRYHTVLKWGADRGLRIAEGVRLYLQFGSSDVRDWCRDQGMVTTLEQVGAQLLGPSCGACINAGPGVSMRPDQVTVSAINRNFPGRSGPGQVWLASPETVAASALAGKLCSFAELKRTFASSLPESCGLCDPSL